MENFATNTQIHGHTVRAICIGFFFCSSLFLKSQSNLFSDNKKALKTYYKAEKKVKDRDFEGALELFANSAKLDQNFSEPYLRMGSLYSRMGEEDSVYSSFVKYEALSRSPKASVLERLASMALDRGHYQQSKKYLDSFLALVPTKKSDPQIQLLEQSIKFALVQINKPMQIKIEELPSEINSYKLQYLPAMTVDKKTMVFTKRDHFGSDEDIVVSYFKDQNWSKATSISGRINTPSNEGAATISADGRLMIFTACDRRDSKGSCDLYVSSKSGEIWARPKNLGGRINTKYWESQPSLSADGKTLYFSSTRPGGNGGRDIWVTYKKDNDWTIPKNLGGMVNSYKDETTPFIHSNGETLFFSSNSYAGMGGYDLFVVENTDSIWSKPKNLGYPINTHKDEVALLLSPDGAEGYFAKETQKNYEILDSKIVKFSVPKSIQPKRSYYLSGVVVDGETKEPLKANLQIVDIVNNESIFVSTSDSISGQFYLVLPFESHFAGYVKKKGYLYKDFKFSSGREGLIESDTLEIALMKVRKGGALVLENIYFETGSYELDERSSSEINNVIELLLQNPEITIEISGHTDNVGNSEYNYDLSEKRAFAVVAALNQLGIPSTRLRYKGYGDSLPIRPNDNEMNRKSNRRIEFRVLRTSN